MAEEMEENEDDDDEEEDDDEDDDQGGGGGYDARTAGQAGKSDAYRVPANEHLQLQPRSPSPEGMHARKRRRRLNAEELAVADGLLGLQEASDNRILHKICENGQLTLPSK